MLTDLPSGIVELPAADAPSKPAIIASQPPAPELQACAGGEATAQEAPPAPAPASLPALSSSPEVPVPKAAPAAPRRPKLQPGDFYITLPKPPTMATPRDDGCEDGGAGASVQDIGHSQPSSAGLADAAGSPQAADVVVEGQSSPEQGSHLPGSAVLGGHAAAEELVGNKTIPADTLSAQQAGRSQELGQAGQQAASPVPEWRRETSLRAEMDAAEAFSEQQSSSRARQAAAAARKEEAQELALEQAILVRSGLCNPRPVSWIITGSPQQTSSSTELCLSFIPLQDNVSQAPEAASVLDPTQVIVRLLRSICCRRCTGGKPRRARSQARALLRSAITARPVQ